MSLTSAAMSGPPVDPSVRTNLKGQTLSKGSNAPFATSHPAAPTPPAEAPSGSPGHVVSMTVPMYVGTGRHIQDVEKYLKAHGWENVGINEFGMSLWADPQGVKGAKAIHKTASRLPIDGGEEVIKQWYAPPIPWNYNMTEAMSIQQQRDRYGETLEALIKRKERELQDMKDYVAEKKLEEELAQANAA